RNPSFAAKYGLSPELIDSVRPVSIIERKGYGEFPAEDIIQRMGIKEPGDPKLAEAKKQVYKDGYHTGRMKAVCGKYAGMRVEEAKDKMREAMLESGEAELFYDLTEEVVCRCGSRVHIKKLNDQWFINYADEKLTEETIEHTRKMSIYPQEYKDNVESVLRWYRERACVRQGNWLGTKFPFDEKWTIEAISDSTLYPIYYLISPYANGGRLKPEQMTEEFFDYVILGKGDIRNVSDSSGVPVQLLEDIRKDVLYWYPLDMNLGGKEHMTVHFPGFLLNHTAVLPEEMRPAGITVNWYVTGKNSDKISKSKGGAQPIPGAAAKFGVDSMRLYYAHVASMFVDVEWSEETVISYKLRIERIASVIQELLSRDDESSASSIDAWIVSRFNTHLAGISRVMESNDLRSMATIVYFEMLNDVKWYTRRGGFCRSTVKTILRIWIQCMMPVTPHIAEELWESAGFEGLVSASLLPEPDYGSISEDAEYTEELLREVMSDITEVRKIAKIEPKRAILYTSPAWTQKVIEIGAEMKKNGTLSIPELIKACMADDSIKSNGKAASEFAKKTASELMKSGSGGSGAVSGADEYSLFMSARDFLAKEMALSIDVYKADQQDIYDPQKKSKVAVPGRPAIYLE
ncbi:MAG: class I tRNA ligase family protein, partial [Candidatus Methanomethylophilaceae archaeon]|nr:class I tRNA ligase family protein [Candidatus Methanomethylophilaceae archaeon]